MIFSLRQYSYSARPLELLRSKKVKEIELAFSPAHLFVQMPGKNQSYPKI